MAKDSARASMWEQDGRWHARLEGRPPRAFSAATREACSAALRRAVGKQITLTIDVYPPLAGVAEAAAILGWDKRRIITYLNRGAFPKPVASLAGGRIWRRSDVEDFARAWHGRHASELKAARP